MNKLEFVRKDATLQMRVTTGFKVALAAVSSYFDISAAEALRRGLECYVGRFYVEARQAKNQAERLLAAARKLRTLGETVDVDENALRAEIREAESTMKKWSEVLFVGLGRHETDGETAQTQNGPENK